MQYKFWFECFYFFLLLYRCENLRSPYFFMTTYFVLKSRIFLQKMTFFEKKLSSVNIFFARNRSTRWVLARHCRDNKMHTYLDVYTCEKKNINACCLKRSFIFITKIVHVRLFTMKSIFKRKRCTFDTPKTFCRFWKKSTYCILYTETSYNLQADKNLPPFLKTKCFKNQSCQYCFSKLIHT